MAPSSGIPETNRQLVMGEPAKVAVVGVGAVGRAAAAAILQRGSAADLVLVDRNEDLARSVALDLTHGQVVSTTSRVRAGGYEAVAGSQLVVIAAGTNEKDGGATDRSDPAGRLRLLDTNVAVVEDIAAQTVAAAPDAVILVVTNPPDPLADIARERVGHRRVMSSGTFLDSLRFRTELAREFGVSPQAVSANVLGEHGTTSVLHWSAVTIGGVPLARMLDQAGKALDEVKPRIEAAVRGANLDIIAGLGASQYGIGAVVARLVEAVLGDERMIAPVGSRQAEAGLTFSLPSVIGAGGVEVVLDPGLDPVEREALDRSIAALRAVADRVRGR